MHVVCENMLESALNERILAIFLHQGTLVTIADVADLRRSWANGTVTL
jgi:hypothetical protein